MKGGIGNLMRQAQEMQANMQKAQEELASLEVTGTAGGGMVEAIMTGKHEVRRVKIDPSLLEDDDAEMLEDLVAAAMNDAVRRVEEASQEKFSGMSGGMGDIGSMLPPGFKMPF